MPTNTQQCEVGSHLLSQQHSCASSPSPEGSSEPASGSNLSQRCVCTSPPSKAQASCSAKLALLSARKGWELEPVGAMHQITALGLVTATLWRAAFTPCQSKSSSCTLPTVCALPSPQEVCCTELSKFAFVCILHVFLGWRGRGRSRGNSTQYWNYCKQIQIFHVAHPGRNMPCKANSQKGSLKKQVILYQDQSAAF